MGDRRRAVQVAGITAGLVTGAGVGRDRTDHPVTTVTQGLQRPIDGQEPDEV